MTNTVLAPFQHRTPPPSYTAGWMLQEFTNVEQRSGGSAAGALWPYAVQPNEDGITTQRYGYLDIRRYGNVTNGSDITVPLQKAAAAVAGSTGVRRIYIPGGSYAVGATTALTALHAGIGIVSDGAGSCTITRDFNGPLFTLSNVFGFTLRDIAFNGGYGTQTGKGVTFAGVCNYPRIENCDFTGFSDAHIEFAPDCGYNAKLIGNHHFTGSGQSDFLTVKTGIDTTATPRQFLGVDTNGYHDMSGALDAQFAGCFQTRIVTSVNTAEFTAASTVWADQVNFNAHIPITLAGVNMFISATRFANEVVLASGSSGTLHAGSSGIHAGDLALTDLSGGGWAVFYREVSGLYHWVGRSALTATIPGEIRQTSVQKLGDQDFTYQVDAQKSTLLWNQASFTANRTLTLSTTGVRDGCTVDAIRPAGDTAGPWTLNLNGTGKTLAAGGRATFVSDGTAWFLTDIGTGL